MAGLVGAVGVEAEAEETVRCVVLRGRSVVPLREERKDKKNGHEVRREEAGLAGAAG